MQAHLFVPIYIQASECRYGASVSSGHFTLKKKINTNYQLINLKYLNISISLLPQLHLYQLLHPLQVPFLLLVSSLHPCLNVKKKQERNQESDHPVASHS